MERWHLVIYVYTVWHRRKWVAEAQYKSAIGNEANPTFLQYYTRTHLHWGWGQSLSIWLEDLKRGSRCSISLRTLQLYIQSFSECSDCIMFMCTYVATVQYLVWCLRGIRGPYRHRRRALNIEECQSLHNVCELILLYCIIFIQCCDMEPL